MITEQQDDGDEAQEKGGGWEKKVDASIEASMEAAMKLVYLSAVDAAPNIQMKIKTVQDTKEALEKAVQAAMDLLLEESTPASVAKTGYENYNSTIEGYQAVSKQLEELKKEEENEQREGEG